MNEVDKRQMQVRFSRSQKTYRRAALVQTRMADALISALAELRPQRDFQHILELGCGDGLLTDRIEEILHFQRLNLVDLVADFAKYHQHRRNTFFLAGDMENMSLPAADLVLAGAALQWAVNLPGLLSRLQSLLPAGGILAFSTFGPENLFEIATLTGRSLSYPTLQELIALLTGKQFSVLMSHEERICLTFSDPLAVLRHLRETGVNGLKTGSPWNRSCLEKFAWDYRQNFCQQDGLYPLSYHPIWIIAEKQNHP